MDSGVFTLIIMTVIIGLFLLWRIPLARRWKREEQEFIAQHIKDYAILTFYGHRLEIAGWVFYDDKSQFNREHIVESIDKIRSYYGRYTLAIPQGEYDSVAVFDFNYANGSKTGGTGYTREIRKKLSLQKGCVYRYRLKDISLIDKKIPYTTVFEEVVASKPANYILKHTAVLEQLLLCHYPEKTVSG